MKYNLQKVDELYLASYKYLTPEDECYFFMNYTRLGLGFTDENDLMMNFKKGMDRKGRPAEWKWKGMAIGDVSEMFIQNIPPIIQPSSILVPVPPSCVKGDEMYDDRLTQVLANYCKAHPATEYREIVTLDANMTPTHEEEKTPEELMNLYTVDEGLCHPEKNQIVIVDDVLRHGAHFRAMKNLLEPHFPLSDFVGLFIARNIH